MSFFDDASLAFLPSGGAGKDTKAYSIKPTDGSGDFTFSRGSNLAATRVGPTGLIEKGRENLLTYSNDFSNAAWIQSGTITSGQSGYDGTNNAWKFENPSITSSMYQPNTNSGVQTISAYFKKNATYGVRFFAFGSSNANTFFDLNNGVVVAQNNTIDASVEPVGTDWFRCSMTINQTNSRCDFYVTNNAQVQVLGHFTIQDAQLEIGLAATEVITTGATTGKAGLLEDEPRFDYSGGATCPSLLLEPSRTNLVKQSEYFEGSEYSVASANLLVNAETSPEGLTNASTLETTGNFAQIRAIGIGTISAGNNTFSVFAKYSSSQYIILRNRSFTGGTNSEVWFDIQNGTKGGFTTDTPIDYDIENYGNGWYRCYLTFNVDAADVAGELYLYNSNTDESYNTGIGDTSIIYGFQLEAGSYPTSYIPNHSGGSVTRGKDEGETSTIEDVTEGVLFFEGSVDKNENSIKLIELHDGTSNNRIYLYYRDSTGTLPRLYAFAINGGSQAYGYAYDIPSGKGEVTHKVAFRFADNNFGLYYNGVEVHTQTSGIISTNARNQISFASYLNTLNFSGKAKQLLLFPTALSDADCINITSL